MSEDCAAVGFSGEGRCIQRAIIGPLCDEHAEFGADPVYADCGHPNHDAIDHDCGPFRSSHHADEIERLVALADRLAAKIARVDAIVNPRCTCPGACSGPPRKVRAEDIRAALDTNK